MSPDDALESALQLLDSPMANAASTTNKLGYVFEEGKTALSYSRGNTLNTCPRKYQLREKLQQKNHSPSIHTAFGHMVGAGIAALFEYGGDLPRAMVAGFALWDYPAASDLFGKEKTKSVASAFAHIESFYIHHYPSFAEEYEIAILNGRPASELFVYVSITDKHNYQVHIDLILRSKFTGALLVVEFKTSVRAATAAQWENSRQTVGYFAILETLARRENIPIEPGVIYFCIQSGKMWDEEANYGVQVLPFAKTPDTMVDFVQELMYDINRIDYMEEQNFYPKNGASCVDFNRPCEFFQQCDTLIHTVEHTKSSGAIYQSLTLEDCDYVLDLQEIVDNIQDNHLTQS